MKNDFIVRAFDETMPDTEASQRIFEKVMEKSDELFKARRKTRQRMLILAACVCLAAALGTVGYAVHERWSLPEPQTYKTTEKGVYDLHETHEYTETEAGTYEAHEPAETNAGGYETPDLIPTEKPAISDEDFIGKAVLILENAGIRDIDASKVTVIRQKHLYWDREEAEVLFSENEINTTVTFDSESGVLLGISSIDWAMDEGFVCADIKAGAALAEKYYHSLPMMQGYVLRGHTEYDEQYWSFDFCREVSEGLYSDYECARIAINAKTGRLVGCNAFYVPLLDDHEEGDLPLTQTDAEKIASSVVNTSHYQLKSAEKTVVLPNWLFSGKGGPENKACTVTRLAWRLIYENPDSIFADLILVDIDYYTGEILGGDMT